MINSFKNRYNNLQKNPASIVSMYVSFTLLIVFLFGIVGTAANINKIGQFNAKKNAFNNEIVQIREKKEYLTKLEDELTNYQENEDALDLMIPSNDDFNEYIYNIIDATAELDYKIEKFVFTPESPTEALVSITFAAEEGKDLIELIEAIEKTPRIAVLEEAHFNANEKQRSIKLDMRVYSSQKDFSL